MLTAGSHVSCRVTVGQRSIELAHDFAEHSCCPVQARRGEEAWDLRRLADSGQLEVNVEARGLDRGGWGGVLEGWGAHPPAI